MEGAADAPPNTSVVGGGGLLSNPNKSAAPPPLKPPDESGAPPEDVASLPSKSPSNKSPTFSICSRCISSKYSSASFNAFSFFRNSWSFSQLFCASNSASCLALSFGLSVYPVFIVFIFCDFLDLCCSNSNFAESIMSWRELAAPTTLCPPAAPPAPAPTYPPPNESVALRPAKLERVCCNRCFSFNCLCCCTFSCCAIFS
mmetsp:Transcript_16085/g.33975  ORF Transcript_16085/g.33975 Transcript_16085/m.33975 type:complete len:201 (+) Transcript_16085:1425-2027(+)